MLDGNNLYTDEFVTENNILNLSFKNILAMHMLRDHDEIVEIFRLGGMTTAISKSKVKSWTTDPEKSERGTPMPRGLFYSFVRGLHKSMHSQTTSLK